MKDPFHPINIFLLFFFLQIVFPYSTYFALYYLDEQYLGLFKADAVSIDMALLVSFVYLLFWLFGYHVTSSKFKIYQFDARAPSLMRWQLVGVSILFVIISLLSVSIFSSNSVGPRSQIAQGDNGKIVFLSVVYALVFFWIIIIKARQNLFQLNVFDVRRLSLIILLVIVFVALGALGGRGRAVFAALGALFITHYNIAPISMSKVSLIAICIFIGGSVLTIIKLDLDISQFRLLFEFLFGHFGGRNFDGLYNIAAIIKQIDFPVSYGMAMISGAISDVFKIGGVTSRTILMQEVFGVRGEILFGVNPTKIGEILINFGYLGVPVFAFLYGSISKILYQALIIKKSIGEYSSIFYFLIVYYHGTAHLDQYVSEKIVYLSALFLAFFSAMIAMNGFSRVKKIYVK